MQRLCLCTGGPPQQPYVPVADNIPEGVPGVDSTLVGLSLGQLQKLASKEHPEVDLEDALDEDNPKGAIIALLSPLRQAVSPRASAAKKEARRKELSSLKLGALQKRASVDFSQDQIEVALDNDEPKQILINMLLDKVDQESAGDAALEAAQAAREKQLDALRAELSELKLGALQKRAAAEGVDADKMSQALDEDSPKEEVITLLLELLVPQVDVSALGATAAAEARRKEQLDALRAELSELKLGALQKRAAAEGVDADKMSQALDEDSPKEEVITLLLELLVPQVDVSALGATAAAEARRKEQLDALRAELSELKLGALQKRAAAEGVDADKMAGALDEDSPKEEVIALLLELMVPQMAADPEAIAAAAALEAEAKRVEELTAELTAMKLGALQKRATAEGLDAIVMGEALDSDSPKLALVEAMVASSNAGDSASVPASPADNGSGVDTTPAPTQSDEQANEEDPLFKHLEAVTLKKYYAKLKKLGVDRIEQLEQVTDEDMTEIAVSRFDRKSFQSMINSLKAQSEVKAKGRPHHSGSGKSVRNPMARKKKSAHKGIFGGKHAMLSYEWDTQQEVMTIRDGLVKRGVRCWMDIDGGMQGDIYQSMAEGVQGAACIIAFMTQKYQDSENCQLELKFGKQSGVPIIPVMMQEGWKAGGWLGIVTAGCLWTPFFDETKFTSNLESLVQQLTHHRPEMSGESTDDDDDYEEAFSLSDRQKELSRLQEDITGVVKDDGSKGFKLPANVPDLPSALMITSEMRQLHKLLTGSQDTADKVGFYGMGGIGKTVVSTWLVRHEAVRTSFSKLIWLPLGQTPNLKKLQETAYHQMTGDDMAPDFAHDDRCNALRNCMKGVNLLLILDDIWEAEHEEALNFVDFEAGSKVLLSSRIRGNLQVAEDTNAVEVKLPNETDAVKLLMDAAGVPGDVTPPPEARQIVGQCGRLPLAITVAGKSLRDMDVSTGQSWKGVVEMIADEMKESGSIEENIINIGLQGLPGRPSEQQNMRDLFFAMGLVPGV
jgi:hypothetical protein